jgi:outer membrane beta-barrel protein
MENQATSVGHGAQSRPQENERALGVRWGLAALAMIWAVSWSPSASAASESATPSDEYSFSWLDKDKKIYVLQNRRYTKAGRVLLSAGGGVGSSNPYRDIRHVEARLAFFPWESLGFEALYSKTFNSENATFDALQAKSVMPFVREINSTMGAMVHWVPWYAKINVFNRVLYFDWGFQAGLAQIDATAKYKFGSDVNTDPIRSSDDDQQAFLLGTTQQFFLSHHWSLRLDVLGSFFKGAYKTGDSAISSETTWFSNFQYGLSLGYRL